MNKSKLKELIQQSAKSPSANFTDNLMHAIKQEQQENQIAPLSRSLFWVLGVASCLAILLLSYAEIPPLHYFDKLPFLSSLLILKIPLFVFILFMMHRLYEVYELVNKMRLTNQA